MTAPELAPWAAIAVSIFVILGAGTTLIGAVGLLRLETFYARAHAPTIGSSGGIACIAVAAIICFSGLEGRIVLGPALIVLFVTMTTPVTLMLLARAALFRDRAEGNPDVPPPIGLMDVEDGGKRGSSSL